VKTGIRSYREGLWSLLFLIVLGCLSVRSWGAEKVIVLGMDGLDPKLLERFMAEGRLPHFKQLADRGGYAPLGTSIPPQSPVAWSNFITGANPGTHGIFDFIHRDPRTYIPEFSLAQAEQPGKSIRLFGYRFPLPGSGGGMKLMREGEAFWSVLEKERGDVPITLCRVPANFPPVEMKGRAISGMGTPDLLGGYGSFSYYTTDPPEGHETVSGGNVYVVYPLNNQVKCTLHGPQNGFKVTEEKEAPSFVDVDFLVKMDPENPVALIEFQDQEVLLAEKEWSDWVHVEFDQVPMLWMDSAHGAVRFYLKSLRPEFSLYVTPIQIDPMSPDVPICTPPNYTQEVAEAVGCFYTQGLAEDTKALSGDILDDGEFLDQAELVYEELVKHFDYELSRFQEGLLFYYFGTSDQCAHMMWRAMDGEHPGHFSELDAYRDALAEVYQKMDSILAKALEKAGDDTVVMVMSDHGFSPFYRGFHLNSWLADEGYLGLRNPYMRGKGEFLSNVDWGKTKAYGLGLNSLYVNLEGREAEGTVTSLQKTALVDKLCEKLLAVRDPKTGEQVVLRAYKTSEVYSGPQADSAPEIIVGYKRGYRASWATSLGSIPEGWFEDNKEAWSADHCMAAEELPGVFVANRPLQVKGPALYDVTATVLAQFGVKPTGQMIGKAIF